MCFILETFDVVVSKTETTVTTAPAIKVTLMIGRNETHIVTLINYASPRTLRLCRVIDAPT